MPDGALLLSLDEPPLDEVALAVQFEPGTVDFTQSAAFRERVKAEFPNRQEQPARPPMEESFAPPTSRAPIEIQVFPVSTVPRLWFVSDDDTLLFQVQHDLLAFNWRRRPDGRAYPRYEALREQLARGLSELDEILRDDGANGLSPNWCLAPNSASASLSVMATS